MNNCDYINADIDNASSMLRKCINGGVELGWPCKGDQAPYKGISNDKLLKIYTERPQGDNIKGTKLSFNTIKEENIIEGFTTMGEKYVPPGKCPDGYRRCPKTGTCKQVCMACKYRDNMKSMEFNEFDRCFPKHGVYAGITNSGLTKCTCGKNNQYCGNMYTSDGSLLNSNNIVLSIGSLDNISKLAAF